MKHKQRGAVLVATAKLLEDQTMVEMSVWCLSKFITAAMGKGV